MNSPIHAPSSIVITALTPSNDTFAEESMSGRALYPYRCFTRGTLLRNFTTKPPLRAPCSRLLLRWEFYNPTGAAPPIHRRYQTGGKNANQIMATDPIEKTP